MTKPTITNQAIFDRVATHLLTQRAQAMDGDSCAYRGQDNTKCAVGVLIEDKDYDPKFEGLDARAPAVVKALPFEVTENQIDLLVSLQQIHDKHCPGQWAGWLAILARHNELNFTHPVPK